MAPPLIAVAGNVNADIAYQVPRLPRPGETLLAEKLLLGPGGKAGNASVALARLGSAPRLIGCVGDDPLGVLVLGALEREGVAVDRIVRRSGAVTGLATVLAPPGAENAIVTHLGANLTMTTAGLATASMVESRDALEPLSKPVLETCGVPAGERSVLHGCSALLMTLGLPRAVLLELAREARARGVVLVVDATPLREDLPARELLAADVLSANLAETEQLTGRAVDPADEDSVMRACADLCALGAGAAVVKLGARGAAWAKGASAGSSGALGASDRRLGASARRVAALGDGGAPTGHVAAPAVQAVDPTGAGDAFMAGLTLRLVEGASLAAAVEFACLLGALSTTAPGAQGGWTGIDDVERLAAALASRGTHSCAGVSAGSLTRHLVPPGCASKAGS